MDWLLVPLAYLIGSLQPGLVLVRLLRGIDVREIGSGKTGTTNVLRAGGARIALASGLLDCAKGIVPVLIAQGVSDNDWTAAGAATGGLLGHMFPVFTGFRGGRGVATGAGAAGALLPWTAIVGLGVFAPVVAATRYASLGSILAVAGVVAAYGSAAALGDIPLPHLYFALVCGPLVVWMHRDNIRRLINGTERRLGESASTISTSR